MHIQKSEKKNERQIFVSSSSIHFTTSHHLYTFYVEMRYVCHVIVVWYAYIIEAKYMDDRLKFTTKKIIDYF